MKRRLLALGIAATACAIAGLATGRSTFYGVGLLCLAAIPVLSHLA